MENREKKTFRLGIRTVLAALLVMQNAACAHDASEESSSIPMLSQWEYNMTHWGRYWGERLVKAGRAEEKTVNAVYYDAARVYYQIATYTGKTHPWLRYANLAENIYIDDYCIPNNFRTSGYWRFSHGTYDSWLRHPTPEKRKFLKELRDKPAYSDIDTHAKASNWLRADFSREMAYAIEAQVLAARAGAKPRTEALSDYVNAALEHLRIWRTGDFKNPNTKRHFRKPFMFGLTGEALITYYQYTVDAGNPDKRILPALEKTADWFWKNTWIPNIDGLGDGAFMYLDHRVSGVGTDKPAPDLNLLIAPVYAWLYKETGDDTYRVRADKIFVGGVTQACLKCTAKIFNQNYRWSFDYVRWRREGWQRTSEKK